MIEAVGVINVGRYLKEEPAGHGIYVYLEQGEDMVKVTGVIRYASGMLAAIISTDGSIVPVNLSTPLYLSIVDLTTLDSLTVKSKARSAVLPIVEKGMLHYCESVPLASYYNG